MRWLVPGFFCVLMVSSCEKAKQIAVQAKTAVSEGIEKAKHSTDGGADEALEGLVDRNEQGFRFRNDLPFPGNASVVVRKEATTSGRALTDSLLGQQNIPLSGTLKSEERYVIAGSRVNVTYADVLHFEGIEKSEDEPGKVVKPTGKLAMEWRDGRWQHAKNGQPMDFSRAAEATGNFDNTMKESGLLPRPFWFGKGRIKEGDTIALTGEHLLMLLPGGQPGRLEITLEGMESIHGHPCGVFSVRGDVSNYVLAGLTGGADKGDLTIESGKVWLSLVYPLVLREDLQTVFTLRSVQGSPTKQITRGTMHLKIDREWSAAD